LYGEDDRDQAFASRMGILGASFQYKLNHKSHFRMVVSKSHQQIRAVHHLVFRHTTDTFEKDGKTLYRYAMDSLVKNMFYHFRTNTTGLHMYVHTRLSSRANLRYGLNATAYDFQFRDSARNFDAQDSQQYWKWSTRWNSNGKGLMLLPYVQMKWQATKKLGISGGLTAQYAMLSDEESGTASGNAELIQPRLGMRYQLSARQSLNFGFGIHSQMQPAYTHYYIKPGNKRPHNLGMGLTSSTHYVLGYELAIGKDKRFKAETYYQNLSGIPVEKKSSSFSLANTGSGFTRFFPDTLENTGTAYNYGIELTMEKSFTRGYYYLGTLSLFNSKYRGSDRVWRSTDFNTSYAFNALLAREWKVGKRSVLNIGGKITTAGARRYSPMDTAASIRAREYIEQDSLKNTRSFGSAYFRVDFRLSYKINTKRFTHEFALDLVNLSNRKNILKYSYSSEPPYYRQEYQLGFLPLFYYKLDF